MNLLNIQKEVSALRRGDAVSSEVLGLRCLVRSFQNNRLRLTYRDLAEQNSTADAARFFLEHLYGTKDLSGRDSQAERVLPKADKYLPSGAVEVLALVLEMDLLAERMDFAVAEKISEMGLQPEVQIDDAVYLDAFRRAGMEEVRLRQIDLISDVGGRLVKLMRVPMLGAVLRMTRGAAQKANLEDFHEFLSDGVTSFKSLSNPRDFFAQIQNRERRLLDLIFREGICVIPDLQTLGG